MMYKIIGILVWLLMSVLGFCLTALAIIDCTKSEEITIIETILVFTVFSIFFLVFVALGWWANKVISD